MTAAQAAGDSGHDEGAGDTGAAVQPGGEVRAIMCGCVDLVDDSGVRSVGEDEDIDGGRCFGGEAEAAQLDRGGDFVGEAPCPGDADDERVPAIHELICLK